MNINRIVNAMYFFNFSIIYFLPLLEIIGTNPNTPIIPNMPIFPVKNTTIVVIIIIIGNIINNLFALYLNIRKVTKKDNTAIKAQNIYTCISITPYSLKNNYLKLRYSN